jgi:hypothetical protein
MQYSCIPRLDRTGLQSAPHHINELTPSLCEVRRLAQLDPEGLLFTAFVLRKDLVGLQHVAPVRYTAHELLRSPKGL